MAENLEELILLKSSQRMEAINREIDAKKNLKLGELAARGIRGGPTETVNVQLALKRVLHYRGTDDPTRRDCRKIAFRGQSFPTSPKSF